MVAEIFFWPPGTTVDPIPREASPPQATAWHSATSCWNQSGNPGYPATHTVSHTFIVKPSVIPIEPQESADQQSQAAQANAANRTAAAATRRYPGPDELIIRWGNVPRAAEAMSVHPVGDPGNQPLARHLRAIS